MPKGERLKRIQKSPNYKNGAFQNLEFTPTFSEHYSFGKLLKAYFKPTAKKPVPLVSIPYVKLDLHQTDFNNSIVWMGHSSYFMRIDGLNVLVDPALSGYASPFSFSVKSFEGSNPFCVDDLPEIDWLIISHDHYDHLDYQTLLKLKPKVKNIVTSLGVGEHLEYWGYSPSIINELDWYEECKLQENLTITATPARHFSGRLFKRNQTLYSSFVLKSKDLNLFLGGDSGYGNHFKSIGEKFGPFDFAILETGQYNLFWKNIHAMPDEMTMIIDELQARKIMPVHNSKFKLALHDWDEPLREFSKNAKEKNIKLFTPKIGEILSFYEEKEFPEWWNGI
jgi:L-ascorbate metabolism protein UlaG (beta-lactamase superfamily)